MKKIKFFGRKKRIKELEQKLTELEKKFDKSESNLRETKSLTNNFPPFAITAIPNSQMEEIIGKKDLETLRHLVGEYIKFIEQHDLKVDFMFMPKFIYQKFCKMMKCKRSFWGIKIIPVTGLNSSIFISNLKSSDEYIVLDMEKNDDEFDEKIKNKRRIK